MTAPATCLIYYVQVIVLTWEVGTQVARNGRRIMVQKPESAFVRLQAHQESTRLERPLGPISPFRRSVALVSRHRQLSVGVCHRWRIAYVPQKVR
jgi:hypothetical protein